MEIEKVKINAPTFLVEILEEDIKHFNLSKSGLYNLIFLNCALNFRSNYSQELQFDDKKYIQIPLNKENRKLFNAIIKGQLQLNNSDIMKEIFLSYAIMPAFMRETVLFRGKLSLFIDYQKKYRMLNMRTPDGIIEGRIEKIFRDKMNNYFRIKITGKDYYFSQCEIIS